MAPLEVGGGRARASSTDPDSSIELFTDSRFDNTKRWFGDLRFAFKSYAYGGVRGAPSPFPDMAKAERTLVQAVQEAEACDDSGCDDEEADDEEKARNATTTPPAERFSITAILQRLATKPTMLAIRFLGWALSKLFRSAFSSVHVHNSHVVAQTVARVEAANSLPSGKRTALVLLPTHRSHADYLLLSFIFFGLNLPVPTIAAGDNLNVPLLGRLLSAAGAFFIRRAGQSERYRLVLQGYLFLLCKAGVPVEFFIEGGRTRRGSVGRPKVGLLSMIVQMVRDGDLQDALLVPLSIDYDRVPEGNGFANEVLGTGQKKPESLLGTVRALVEWLVWGQKEGAVYVGFADRALSVRDMLEERENEAQQHNKRQQHGHHQHMHAAVGGTFFRGGSTASLVLAQDNALAHEMGRRVVDAQRECALVGSGALAACAMLMSSTTQAASLEVVEQRVGALHSLLVDLGHGHRVPPVERNLGDTVATLLRASSKTTCSKTTRICLRYAAAPLVVRLLPICAVALSSSSSSSSDHTPLLLLSWLSGMYDIEQPAPAAATSLSSSSSSSLSPALARDLRRLVAPVVLILECALRHVQSSGWRVGETRPEPELVSELIRQLAHVPYPELSAPLEISAALRACVIHGVLKRTNVKKDNSTVAAFTLLPPPLHKNGSTSSSSALELGLRALQLGKRRLEEEEEDDDDDE